MSLATVQETQERHDHIHELSTIRLRFAPQQIRGVANVSRDIGVHVSLHAYDESKKDGKGAREQFSMAVVRVNLHTTYLGLHNAIAYAIFSIFGVRPRDFPCGSAPGSSFGKVTIGMEDERMVEITEANWEQLRHLLVEDDETAHFETWFVVVPQTVSSEERRKMARAKAMGTGGPRFRRVTLPDVQALPSERRQFGLWAWWRSTRLGSM